MRKRILIIGSEASQTEKLYDYFKEESHDVIWAGPDKSFKLTYDRDGIDAFIKDFNSRYAYLDVLIFAESKYEIETQLIDGFNTTLTVNFIMPYLITEGLKTTLRTEEHARIVYMMSKHSLKGKMVPLDDCYDYIHTKHALLLYALDLSAQMKDDHVTVNIMTEDVPESNPLKRLIATKEVGYNIDAVSYLACSNELRYKTGKLYEHGKVLPLPMDKVSKNQIKQFMVMLENYF